jgi:hypothetical protein
LLADDSGPDQAARARSFLAAALAAARDVVHATGSGGDGDDPADPAR